MYVPRRIQAVGEAAVPAESLQELVLIGPWPQVAVVMTKLLALRVLSVTHFIVDLPLFW
jgi:hypothetical protein